MVSCSLIDFNILSNRPSFSDNEVARSLSSLSKIVTFSLRPATSFSCEAILSLFFSISAIRSCFFFFNSSILSVFREDLSLDLVISEPISIILDLKSILSVSIRERLMFNSVSSSESLSRSELSSDSRALNPSMFSLELESFFLRPSSSILVSLSSRDFNSSYLSLYRSAFLACLSIEFIWRFTSAMISFILTRFCSVSSSLLSASFLLDLYFVIPLASSKTSRLSSGLELKTWSILPCSMSE